MPLEAPGPHGPEGEFLSGVVIRQPALRVR
jgi:hypothetical protein